MRSGWAAYLTWALGLVGFCGLHRFYLGRPWTGLLWLLTFGLFFVGQLIDLILIPGMLREDTTDRRLARIEAEQRALRRV